jgi:23S rRNA (pseudouridine1915-N3)-methyltransferase
MMGARQGALRIALICVGKLGASPEAALSLDYARRASVAGRPLGLGPVEIVELDARKGGEVVAKAAGGTLIACDEHGLAKTSRDLAARLAQLRDTGVRRLSFAIGGADGLEPEALEAASERLAFGPQTWPHALVRVMLAEQVYRAFTILAGAPYHRD